MPTFRCAQQYWRGTAGSSKNVSASNARDTVTEGGWMTLVGFGWAVVGQKRIAGRKSRAAGAPGSYCSAWASCLMEPRDPQMRRKAWGKGCGALPCAAGLEAARAQVAQGEADACAHRCQALSLLGKPQAPEVEAHHPVLCGASRSWLVRLLVCISVVTRAHALVPPAPAAFSRSCTHHRILLRPPAVPTWRDRRPALDMCAPQPPSGTSGSDSSSRVAADTDASANVRAARSTGAQSPEPDHWVPSMLTGEWLAGMLRKNKYLNKKLDDELHEMETSVGYDIPGQGQIVEYDPNFLSKAGWMVNLRGTVFSIPFIYWQFLGLLSFALFYAWAAGPMPAVIDVMGMQGVACTSGGGLRLPILKPQTFALSLVGGLLGFLLSLFNSNGLDRWWKTRDCLGVVIGRSVDIARMFATYIQGWDNESEKRAAWYRQQLIRWLNLAHVLVYRQANNQDDLEPLVDDSTYTPARQWLTREELGKQILKSTPYCGFIS
jgi:hypothetical protein